MKYFSVILSVCILFFIIAGQSVAGQRALVFATLNNFSPFADISNGQARGIDVEIVEEICRRIGVPCKIHALPWKRVLVRVRHGEVDGGFAAFKTPSREEYAIFLKHPLHYSRFNIFTRKGNEFTFKKIDDLNGLDIGIKLGFKVSKEFDNAAAADKFVLQEVETLKANIGKLMLRRIDCIASNYQETMLVLKELNLQDQVICLPHPIMPPKGAYLVISKASDMTNKKQVFDKMNKALKTMNEDGTIKRINDKYLR